ncbi:MAG: hypothetical protein HY904_14465 [Deltaproteobacteria bacterium]|nr:hypothetical protein [Deltaproteobacteria bacterium]
MTNGMMVKKGAVHALKEELRGVQAEQRERLEELLALIERNVTAIKDAFFEVGTSLAEINNNRLYVAAGYASFSEMLEARGLMSTAQAAKLIAVAQLVPRESAIEIGHEKAYALTRYAQAGGVAVKGLLNGKIDGRPIRELTVREFNAATRKLQARRGPGRQDGREERKAAREAQAELRRRGLQGVTVKAVRYGSAWVYRIDADRDALERLTARTFSTRTSQKPGR